MPAVSSPSITGALPEASTLSYVHAADTLLEFARSTISGSATYPTSSPAATSACTRSIGSSSSASTDRSPAEAKTPISGAASGKRRIVPVAAITAMAANTESRREIIGLGIGPSEAEAFWTDFLRSLKARGLDGVKLVISDAHTGLKGAIARVFEATWQRCRVHWMRNALAHISKGQHTVVAAAIRQAFEQPDRKHAGDTWRHVAEQVRTRWPKLADLMDASEHDVLAYMAFPRQHRTKLHSTNPLERLNKEVKRRADVVGIFPNEASIMRLIGAVLFEQNDEWQTSSRYMMAEAFAQIDKEEIDPILSITTKAA